MPVPGLPASVPAERPPVAPAVLPPPAATAKLTSESVRPATPGGEVPAVPATSRSCRPPQFQSRQAASKLSSSRTDQTSPELESRASPVAPQRGVSNNEGSDVRVDCGDGGGGYGGLLNVKRYPTRVRNKPDYFVGK